MFGFNLWFLVALALAAGGVLYTVDQNGFHRCEMKQNIANVTAEFLANEKIENIKLDFKQHREEVHNAPDTDNGPVAPVLERTLDGMRKRNAARDR